MTVKRTGSPKREVRSKHLARGAHSRDTSLNNVKDSSAKPRQNGQEHRRHRHHEHSSPESELSCGRCMKRARKHAQATTEAAGQADLAARLERPEREREASTARDLRRRVEQQEQLERVGAQPAAVPVQVTRTERRSRSRTVNSRAASPPRPVAAQRDPRQVELMRARDIQRAQAATAAVRQMAAVPARPALARSNSERAPARQLEIIPTRQQAVRQPVRQPVRTAERTAQRHAERPQPQPPPAPPPAQVRPAERTARERGPERVQIRPARRQHMRTQSEQLDRTRQVEIIPGARRQSLRAPVVPAPALRATRLRPQPQPQPERPILEFELGTKPQKLFVAMAITL